MLSNWEQFQFVIGLGSWFDAVFFGLAALLPPVWFAARTTANPLSRRALRLLLAVALLWAVAFLVLAAIMLALADRGGTLVLLLLLPLGVVYGLRKGRRAKSRLSARGGGTTAAALLLLPVPLLVSAALGVALVDYAIGEGTVADLPFDPFGPASDGTVPESIWTGNGALDAALGALRLAGYGALYVFFLSIPYVVGSILAAALLILDGLGWKAPLRVPPPAPAEDDAEPEVNMTRRALTIAIDGPAAAGKGTLAKRLAARYGLPYLDTGLLYRAVGRKAADLGLDLDDPDAAGAVARALTPSALDDGTLRGREAGELASRVAAHPSVRAALNDFQRDFARRPEGAVLDGRDIGTVIAPDASVKIFVTASAEVRARRRDEELVAKGRASDFERILAEVRERDARDAGRSVAPLKPAPDAHLLDTSELDIDAVFQAACMLIDRVLADPE